MKKQYLESVLRNKGFGSIRFSTLSSLSALLLAQGAPIGFFIHQYIFKNNSSIGFYSFIQLELSTNKITIIYIWLGTSLFFTIFGLSIGLLLDSLVVKWRQLEQSFFLFKEFESMKRNFLVSIGEIQSPVASTIEFLKSTKEGIYGPISNDLQEQLKASILDLMKNQELVNQLLNIRSVLVEDKIVSVDKIFSELGKKFKNLQINMQANVSVQVEPIFFQKAIEQMLESLRLQLPRNRLRIRATLDQILGSSPLANYVYFIFDSIGEQEFQYEDNWDWFVTKNIVEWHGGSLWRDQHFSEGVRILIALPIENNRKV